MRISAAVRAAAVLAALFLPPVGILAYPYVHNYHFSGLARLAGRVHPGDGCAATARAFAEYAARRRARGGDDVQLADLSTRDSHPFDHLDPPRRLLHLYDVTLFDDVQLTVLCDPAGRRVERVLYVGD